MKAVILGAGFGNRLNQDLPKPLVKLREDLTILELQLYNLKKILSLNEIVVVVGFRSELIKERYPCLTCVQNDRYAQTNTAASLAKGLSGISYDDVLWLNGDVVFGENVLNELTRRRVANAIWVHNQRVGDEEIKYTLDSSGHIQQLAKTVRNGLGEAIGINFVRKEDLEVFKSCLTRCSDTDYFERAIELAIANDVKFAPLDLRDRFCIEVDFPEDLAKARSFVETEMQHAEFTCVE